MSPDTQVWIAAARAGIAWHNIAPSGRRSNCGRYIGTEDEIVNGHVLPLAEAVERFGSKPCSHCKGSSVPPRIRRPSWTS